VSVAELKRMKELEAENASSNACMPSWHSRTLRSEICSRDNCRAVREVTGGRGAREGTRAVHRQGLQGGQAIAGGLVYRKPRLCMERDRGVIEVPNEIVTRKSRWGFWKLYGGWMVSASPQAEPSRLSRRLHFLRGWSNGNNERKISG
jgi:hypothetical protein